MPSSVRKSSIGPTGNARRGPQKAHIPFRADDLETGKKTGLAVNYVDHKSDEFEPFSEVMGQADGRTPARKKRKSVIQTKTTRIQEEDDDDGEMSMELDDSTASPLAYFTNTRNPPSSSTRRIGQSSSRNSTRHSDVDFDSVPSPRSSRLRHSNAGPSNLSKSTVAYDDNQDDYDDDDDAGGGGFDDYDPPGNDVQRTPRRTSFSAINQDDEDDDEHEIEDDVEAAVGTTPIETSSARKGSGKGKGKARAISPPIVPASDDLPQYEYEAQDDGMGGEMEDDIAQGLQDVEMGAGSDNEDEEEEGEPVQVKKGKMIKKMTKDKQPVEKKRRKVVEIPKEYSPPPGVRRGTRHRYKPLEHWRLEKVVYGKRENGISYVPQIKEIIRIPQDHVEPLGKHGNKRKRSNSVKRHKSESKALEEIIGVVNPEEGWDDDTEPSGVVVDYISKEEVSRRIAFTARMVKPKAAANNDWFFQKVFGDGEFIAAGQLIIPPKGRKPSKGTKDNTYVFYVIEGAVNLKVHETTLVLATGAMFLVPRGNTYFIENIAERDAKLFFTQARKVPLTDDEEEPGGDAIRRTPRRSSEGAQRRVSGAGRSSSAGVAAAHGGTNGLQRRAMSTKV